MRGTGAGAASALTLERPRQLDIVATAAEFVVDATEPVAILFLTQPIAVTNADHDPTKLSFPPLSVGAVRREGFTVDVSHACDRDIAAVGRERSVLGNGDPKAESLAGESKHHQDEINTYGPEKGNEDDALEALCLVNGVAEVFGTARRMSDELITLTGVLDLDVGRIVLGARETGRLGDGLAAWARDRAIIVVLRHDQKPRDTEGGSVGSVDEAIQEIEPGEAKTLERRLFADVGEEQSGKGEGDEGVQVHRQLNGGQVVAGKQGE